MHTYRRSWAVRRGTYIHTYMHTYIHAYIHTGGAGLYVEVCCLLPAICIYVAICPAYCMYAYARMHTHAHAHTCTHMHTHACTHTHARMHTHTHTCTHTHTHACTRMHTCTLMHTHACPAVHMRRFPRRGAWHRLLGCCSLGACQLHVHMHVYICMYGIACSAAAPSVHASHMCIC